jgi:hypothetical protein
MINSADKVTPESEYEPVTIHTYVALLLCALTNTVLLVATFIGALPLGILGFAVFFLLGLILIASALHYGRERYRNPNATTAERTITSLTLSATVLVALLGNGFTGIFFL